MSAAILKDKIHRAIDNIDDEHLLEVVFTILNKNSRFNEFELLEETIEVNQNKRAEFKAWESKSSYMFNDVKKKILENLDK